MVTVRRHDLRHLRRGERHRVIRTREFAGRLAAIGRHTGGQIHRHHRGQRKAVVDFADARKGSTMKEALASEIMDAYQGQGNAIRKRDEVHKMAQANKAFAHFRW